MSKISLHGFNNLTKNLSFSLYKLHYLHDEQAQHAYHTQINEHFSAAQLNTLLVNICHAIGGNVLNIAQQDYLPQGASVTLMISEEAKPDPISDLKAKALVAHLDKSHLCVHTYPEEAPQDGIAIFRADIELSTCGVISPLNVLNYVIEAFDADVIDIDYRVRGMTRDRQGKKLFTLDSIDKVSDFLSVDITDNFYLNEHNSSEHNLFHAKLARKEINLKNSLFNVSNSDFTNEEQRSISAQLKQEIQQLFKSTQ